MKIERLRVYTKNFNKNPQKTQQLIFLHFQFELRLQIFQIKALLRTISNGSFLVDPRKLDSGDFLTELKVPNKKKVQSELPSNDLDHQYSLNDAENPVEPNISSILA